VVDESTKRWMHLCVFTLIADHSPGFSFNDESSYGGLRTVYASYRAGLSPRLTGVLGIGGIHVPLRMASSIIRRVRRLMRTERKTIAPEMPNKRRRVAVWRQGARRESSSVKTQM
jgi:hypothetical protein